eukprot:GHVR01158001.1.p1 GENE.GHVR01158001.1~~GHVR01158001.1.p1  ORF type:complete len:204 (+),score=10.83 GHVR01158001.1:286-897(+)
MVVYRWANVTAGNACTVENTAYIAYAGSNEFIDVVSRGNCVVGLYCDSQQLVCMQSRAIGESCDADKQCQTFNCQNNGVCGESADSPNHFGIWLYVVVGIGIFGGMFATLITLFILHRRQRDVEREKRLQYWREQVSVPWVLRTIVQLTFGGFRTHSDKISCKCGRLRGPLSCPSLVRATAIEARCTAARILRNQQLLSFSTR